MKIIAICCAIFACTSAYAHPTFVDDPEILEFLRAVHETLGAASRAITSCANDGGSREECLCRHEDLIFQFNEAIDALLSEHPEIAELGTVNFRDTDGGDDCAKHPGHDPPG